MYEVNCFDLDGNAINNFFQWDVDQKIVINVKGCASDYLKFEPDVHFSNSKRNEALVVKSLRTGVIINGGTDVKAQPDDSSKYIATLNEGDKVIYTEYIPDAENVGTSSETSREWCMFEYKNTNRYIKSANIERDMKTIIVSVPNILLQEPYPLLVYVYLTDSDDVSSQKTVLYTEIPVRKRAKPHDYMYIENISSITADMIEKSIAQDVIDAKSNAIKAIDNQKRDSIEKVKQTQTGTINKINNLIINNGLSLKTNNDGNGNVTLDILVNKS